MTNEELIRLESTPPCSCGLVSKSPIVAPNGLVSMNAAQNNNVWDIFIK